MTIKRKLPGDRVDITGSDLETDSTPKFTETELLALIGRIAEDNPDLPAAFIEELLLALAEADAGKVSEYEFDEEE